MKTNLLYVMLAALDPRLAELEREVAEIKATQINKLEGEAKEEWLEGGFIHTWYPIKAKLVRIVGFYREPEGYVPEPKPEPEALPEGQLFRITTGTEMLEKFLNDPERAIKSKFIDGLPGAERRIHEALNTSFAYDVVYQHLYEMVDVDD